MQKKLIVLALAGLASTAASAQTNVTIYGVIDNYLSYGSSNNSCNSTALGVCTTNTAGGITTRGDQTSYGLAAGGLSGSRLGFKGEEALGNGLKAIFVYEFGNLDSSSQSNNIIQSRNAYVGLNGGWGTVVAGRINSPGYGFAEAYNPMSGSAFSAQQNISGNTGMTIVAGNAGRLNNVVAYVSPNFSGFSGKAAYAFGEQTTGSNVPNAADSPQGIFGLSLDYANGPLAVGLAYHNLMNIGGTPNTPGARDWKQWELAVGGSYDFKIVKLFASWQNLNQDNFRTYLTGTNGQSAGSINSTGNGSVDGNLWNIGGRIPVGANGAINLAYSQYYNNISGPSNDQRVSNYGIDYEYSLSKRTRLYVGYNYMDNGNNTNFGYGTNSGSSGSVVPTGDNSAWLLGAGVNHTF